jgi:hypothetical protein
MGSLFMSALQAIGVPTRHRSKAFLKKQWEEGLVWIK